MRLNISLTAFTAFAGCGLKKCQKTVLTKLTKLFIIEALSSAVAYVEICPVFLAGLFFGRNFCDLLNGDLSPRVLRV